MGKHQAIKEAICYELANEGRPNPVTFQETMGGTYFYSKTSIKGFLLGVANRLSTDSPAYVFDTTKVKPADCVNARVVDLQGMISEATNPGD